MNENFKTDIYDQILERTKQYKETNHIDFGRYYYDYEKYNNINTIHDKLPRQPEKPEATQTKTTVKKSSNVGHGLADIINDL